MEYRAALVASTVISLIVLSSVAQAAVVLCPEDMDSLPLQDAVDSETEIVLKGAGECGGENEYYIPDGIAIDSQLKIRSNDPSDPAKLVSDSEATVTVQSADRVEIVGIVVVYNGSDNAPAIDVDSSSNVLIDLVNATVSGDGAKSAVRLMSSTNVTMRDSNVTSYRSGDENHGIEVGSGSNVTVSGNRVTLRGDATNSYCIFFQSSSGRVRNSIMSVQGDGENRGLNLQSSGLTVDGNTIEVRSVNGSDSGGNVGVYVDGSDNDIHGNNVTVSGADGGNMGLYIINGDDNSVENSSFYVSGFDDDYGLVIENGDGNNVTHSRIESSDGPDVRDQSTSQAVTYILNTTFDQDDMSFDEFSVGKVLVGYMMSFIVVDQSSNPVEGIIVRINDTQSVSDSENPTSNFTFRSGGGAYGPVALNRFYADRDHASPSTYVRFANYTAAPGIGGANTSFDPSSSGQVTVSIAATGVFSNSSLSTSGNQLQVNSTTSVGAELDIRTGSDVSGATVSIANMSSNPKSANLAATQLGKYLQIEVSDDLSSNMTWAIIKVHYTDQELGAADLQESSLRLHYFNETSGSWSAYDPPSGGVNESANFVWANTTHFSTFGAFGSVNQKAAASVATPPSGGGGGGARIARGQQNATPVIEPDQAAAAGPEEAQEPAGVPEPAAAEEEQADEEPVQSTQEQSNPITGLFTFGLGENDTNSVTGFIVGAEGGYGVGTLGLISALLGGAVVWVKRKSLFGRKENYNHAAPAEAGLAAEDSGGEDGHTDAPGEGGAGKEPGKEQEIRWTSKKNRDQVQREDEQGG